MSNYYKVSELEKVIKEWQKDLHTSEVDEVDTSNISFNTGSTEMLRVAEDGFYVRGVKVPMDHNEAETVYTAFKQFLVWSELHRR